MTKGCDCVKKVLSILFVPTFLFGLMGCSSSIEKIPSISEVAQLKYTEVNNALSGKNIQAIRDAWGEPSACDGKEDVWQLDESMLLMITYNDAGVIESCELVCGTPLAPTT